MRHRICRQYRGAVCFLIFAIIVVLSLVPLVTRKESESDVTLKHLSIRHVKFGMGEGLQIHPTPLVIKQEQRSMVLLKLNRTGSSIIEHILFRYGRKNGLNVHHFRDSIPDVDTLNTVKGNVYGRYDIVSIHSNTVDLRNIVDSGAVKIAIIRHPLSRIISEVNSKFRKQDSIQQLVSLVSTSQPNSMAKAFAVDMKIKPHAIAKLTAELDRIRKQFGFVLLLERLDESIVLLRRMLGWSFEDILYIERDVKSYTGIDFTMEQTSKIKNDNFLDYALYDYFTAYFDELVNLQGDYFEEEVVHLRVILTQVQGYCNQDTVHRAPFVIDATLWHEEISIPFEYCKRL